MVKTKMKKRRVNITKGRVSLAKETLSRMTDEKAEKTLSGMIEEMTDETRFIVSTVLEVKPVRRELLRLARCYQRRYGVGTDNCFDMFRDSIIIFFLDRLDVKRFVIVNAEADWDFVAELCLRLSNWDKNGDSIVIVEGMLRDDLGLKRKVPELDKIGEKWISKHRVFDTKT